MAVSKKSDKRTNDLHIKKAWYIKSIKKSEKETLLKGKNSNCAVLFGVFIIKIKRMRPYKPYRSYKDKTINTMNRGINRGMNRVIRKRLHRHQRR